jgi:hypothetical protein
MERITKYHFYADGGFSNPRFCRRSHGKAWVYFRFY